MTTLREAAQQALEAIIELEYSSSTAVGDRMAREAKQALRQALEADHVEQQLNMVQQNEPVAWALWMPNETQPRLIFASKRASQEVAERWNSAYAGCLHVPLYSEFARAIERAHGIGGEA